MATVDYTYTMTAEQVASKIAYACKDLCFQNWMRVDQAMEAADNGKAKISLGITVSRNGNGHDLETKFSVSVAYKDERDDHVDDPDQATITFEEEDDA